MNNINILYINLKHRIERNTSIQYQIPNSNDFKDKQCVFSNKLTKDDLDIKFKTLEKGIREYIISKS